MTIEQHEQEVKQIVSMYLDDKSPIRKIAIDLKIPVSRVHIALNKYAILYLGEEISDRIKIQLEQNKNNKGNKNKLPTVEEVKAYMEIKSDRS